VNPVLFLRYGWPGVGQKLRLFMLHVFSRTLTVTSLKFCQRCSVGENDGATCGEISLLIGLPFHTQYTHVTNRQMDRRPQ